MWVLMNGTFYFWCVYGCPLFLFINIMNRFILWAEMPKPQASSHTPTHRSCWCLLRDTWAIPTSSLTGSFQLSNNKLWWRSPIQWRTFHTSIILPSRDPTVSQGSAGVYLQFSQGECRTGLKLRDNQESPINLNTHVFVLWQERKDMQPASIKSHQSKTSLLSANVDWQYCLPVVCEVCTTHSFFKENIL